MISMDKEYVTRGDEEVIIYAVDKGGKYPVHGAKKNENGEWDIDCWTADGKFCIIDGDDQWDLIEKKDKFRYERWVNVYATGLEYHTSQGEALQAKASMYNEGYLATKFIVVAGVGGDEKCVT